MRVTGISFLTVQIAYGDGERVTVPPIRVLCHETDGICYVEGIEIGQIGMGATEYEAMTDLTKTVEEFFRDILANRQTKEAHTSPTIYLNEFEKTEQTLWNDFLKCLPDNPRQFDFMPMTVLRG